MTDSPISPTQATPRTNGAKLDIILDAALTAFAEFGFSGASMRKIASHAGTSLSNLYNYFPSKDDLLVAVLKNANDELLRRVTGTVDDADPAPEERLRAAVRAYIGFATDHQPASLVALSEFRYLRGERREEVVAARDSTQELFVGIVADGVAAGRFLTKRPREATRAILLLCATVATWYQNDGELTPDALAEQQAEFALALVKR